MFIYSDIYSNNNEECVSTAISSAGVSLGVDIDPTILNSREDYYFKLHHCTKLRLT